MKDFVRLESITQVHDFLGIPKPLHPLVSVIPIDGRMLNADFGNLTFVLDLFQISLKSGFSGQLLYGRNTYDFEEGTMAFMKPGQTMKIEGAAPSEGEHGWTLLIHPDFLRKSSLGATMDKHSFFSYQSNEALHVSEEEKNTITDLVHKIKKEYSGNLDRHSQGVILSTIELLLSYCTRFYDRQFFTRTNLNQDHATRFEDMLKAYFERDQHLAQGLPTVKGCGQELGMSGAYLSDLLKQETGLSAQEHIHRHVIDKAKTKLLSSNQSVSQIAFNLGFEYPQHFSRLFKSKTGLTPVQFRTVN